jgi:serine/threonine protein phosphatase 1
MIVYNSNSPFSPDAQKVDPGLGLARIGFVKRVKKNLLGRDFFVGDLHGMFRLLEAALHMADFDVTRDRLFCVGDLIDRGPDSELVLEYLSKPWFHAVQGNHEDAAIFFGVGGATDLANYITWGSAWLIGKTENERKEYAYELMMLPYLMEVETEDGLIGICHADTHQDSWPKTVALYENVQSEAGLDRLKGHTLMSRHRITARDPTPVEGVYAVLVGHSPVTKPTRLGNTYYLDTGSCYPKRSMFLLELKDLREIAQMSLTPK